MVKAKKNKKKTSTSDISNVCYNIERKSDKIGQLAMQDDQSALHLVAQYTIWKNFPNSNRYKLLLIRAYRDFDKKHQELGV